MPEPLSPEGMWEAGYLAGHIQMRDALAAAQATVRALREALREEVLVSANGRGLFMCNLCCQTYHHDAPENHTAGCLAALPPEAA